MKDFYSFIRHHIIEIDKLIFEKLNLLVLSLFCLTYILFIYGFGSVPGNGLYLISQNPFVNIFPNHPRGLYLYDSILIPLITYFTGLNKNVTVFLLGNFFLILLGIILFILFIYKEYGRDAAKIALFIFLLSPLSNVLVTWLGYYDSATFFLQIYLLFSTQILPLFFIGLLGSLNHFPIMLFSGITVLLFQGYSQAKPINTYKILLSYILGLGLGYFVLKMYQNHFDLEITVDRLSYTKLINFSEYARYIFKNSLTWLFSFYNILWIVVIFIGHFLSNHSKKLFYIFLGSNIVYFCLTLTVIDSTRVFSLLSFPLLVSAFLYVHNQIENQDRTSYSYFRQFLSGVIIVGLFIPRLVIWQGEIYFSVSWNFMSSMLELIRSRFGNSVN